MRKNWLHQVLSAINLALVIVSVKEASLRPSAFLGKLAYPFYVFLFPLLRRVYRDQSFERYCLFFSMSLSLAVIIFLLLYLSSSLEKIRVILLASEGVTAVSAYPLGILWSRWIFSRISPVEAGEFLLEIVLAVISVTLFLRRKWLVPRSINILLVLAHFSVWAWVAGSFDQPIDLLFAGGLRQPTSWTIIFVAFLLPVLGVISTFIWGTAATFSGNARSGSTMEA